MVVGNGPLKSNVKCLSLNEQRNNIVVCDGGDTDLDAIKNISCSVKGWQLETGCLVEDNF